MTKQLIGDSPRCGKTIKQFSCTTCKIPLIRLDTTTFQCPACLKKVKLGEMIVKECSSDYGYYTNNQARKTIKELLKPKVMNCSDRIRRG